MKISSKGRYALSLITDFNNYEKDKFTSLKCISEKLGISFKYLERIANLLVKNNLLEVSRGKQGGYKLIKELDKYSVGEILKVTEKNLEAEECVTNPEKCMMHDKCKKYIMLKGLNDAINNYLDGISIKDIM